MNFKSVSVNNCYILDKEAFDNPFFNYLNAKAIYSASLFHLAFFKGNLALLSKEEIKQYENFNIDLYRLNSPYLYIPFEINYHEDKLYQSYYESDHFPLSVWLDEKSLIPFTIFIQIIEDILQALKSLEKIGHSHLFLTPEEILVPLQWKAGNHVKLYNIGLNSIVHSVFTTKQISEYRNNFIKDNKKIVEKNLTQDISEDIYSLGSILNRILPLCIFPNDKDKIILQANIDKLLKFSESFNSIDEVILLFNSFFLENNKPQSFNNKNTNFSYTGQANFEIPNFNNWIEEAELIPIQEDTNFESLEEVRDNKISSIFKSVSLIFYRLFSKRKKKTNVSKTLEDYSNIQSKSFTKNNIIENKNNFTKPLVNAEKNSIPDKPVIKNIQTEELLNNIKKHYKKNTNPDIENNTSIPSKSGNHISEEKDRSSAYFTIDKSRYDVKKDFVNPDNIIQTFNKSLNEKDYSRSYRIIEDSLNIGKKSPEKDITQELEKLLDTKLKLLDDHYIPNKSKEIILKLAKLDITLPQEGKEIEETISKNLLELEQTEQMDNYRQEDIKLEKLTLFQKIILFLKTKLSKLSNK